MSEKIYACLLRLYPAKFRRTYGKEALLLFRERMRDETGAAARLRLWFDLLFDFAISLPGQYAGWHAELVGERAIRTAGAPFFFMLEPEMLRPKAFFLGCVASFVALSLTTSSLSAVGTFRHGVGGARPSAYSLVSSRQTSLSGADKAAGTGNATHDAVNGGASSNQSVEVEPFFPPPIDYMSLTDVGANPYAQRFFVYAKAESDATSGLDSNTANAFQERNASTAVPACSGKTALDSERQHVLDAVIAQVKQHYFDPAMGQQMAEALDASRGNCDEILAADGKNFAALLTAQLREVSHDLHVEVVYISETPDESHEKFVRELNALQKDNCSFKRVEILPPNIGYLKVDAFLEPAKCGEVAEAAMKSLNNADAVIFDLRNNHGGTSEMVSLISSYLFDHPEYMFDPRRAPTAQSWTASPVAGGKLANKPVYILTSAITISAAEQFTYDLKMLKRATVVGETTAGGAHAGVWHQIDERFAVVIAEIRPVNPYAQADWEQIGIRPDVAVPASTALSAALKQARERLNRK